MRVLIACEFSGIVRDVFASRGHDAWSCDLLPSERPGNHFQTDIFNVVSRGWDLMIAFPPCTHLAVSGARWFSNKQQQSLAALDFVDRLLNLSIPKIALENPVGIISTHIRKPDQIIQPWEFGDAESKKTCLWLKNLPLLRPTKVIQPSVYGCKCGCRFDYSLGKYGCPNCLGKSGAARLIYSNQTPTGQNRIGPSPERQRIRSRTYRGIANAMAIQWG